MGTILIAAVVFGAFILVGYNTYKNHKNGKGCSGCSGCSAKHDCHYNK